MTLKEFRQATKDLPEDWEIMYEAYYKGCCLAAYKAFANEVTNNYIDREHRAVVLNPGKYYDERGNE